MEDEGSALPGGLDDADGLRPGRVLLGLVARSVRARATRGAGLFQLLLGVHYHKGDALRP